MRKALNDNPVAQIAVLGLLAAVVGFMLLTRVASGGGGETAASSTTAPSAESGVAPAVDSASPTTSSDEAPSTATSPSEASVPPTGSAAAGSVGEFVAGPGLPASVVKAYRDDKTVVLLALRHRGIDDDRLRQNVERLSGRNDLALFVTNAGHIARYSRITYGVNVDRVPALIVLQPRHLTEGTPRATLSYGFRGPESVDQAIRDALYKGPSDLPYYPK